ncbi:hsp70 nucleotide exchange factor fes1 [Coemansia biformis]|uniref:Hsp70 nucleotide exchange factor fes1 n=1 Tax=Coemansia biformis TaxID=1286918 RepID=A0A9W8CVT5_9FUNG|nr:hsp70 nucleotide exchange factor fes1 [Coemansia biformis]
MDSLLKWAILNGATAGEDAPARQAGDLEPRKLDPAIIDAILGKPASVQMTECLDAVEHSETPLEAREIALDDLEMLVENIDNASNIQPLGLWPRLIKLYGDAEPSVRIGALWVSGTAVQHNPKAQAAFSSHAGVQAALHVLESDADTAVRTKALYCVSSSIRANVHGLTEFVAHDGLAVLRQALVGGSNALRQKTFFLLRSLIDEALDSETPEDLRPGMSLPNAIAELGFVDAAAAALGEMAGADQDAGPAVEQALGFLAALRVTDGGSAAMADCAPLRAAVDAARARYPDIDAALD